MSSVQPQPLKTLGRGHEVDEVINAKEKQFVIIRFGFEKDCKQMDGWLAEEAQKITNKAVIYKAESSSVPELVARYNLSGPSTIMFFSNRTVVDRIDSTDKTDEETQRSKFQGIVNETTQPKRRPRRYN